MRTDDTISFYERYMSIREWVERRTLEQGMVQTFAPPGSRPEPPPRRRRRRRGGAARVTAPPREPGVRPVPASWATPQLAFDLG